MMNSIPDNLKSIHEHEEDLFKQVVTMVEGNNELSDHLNIVFSALDSIHIIVTKYKHRTIDELTIQYLGIRIFNSTASCIKLLFSGYYQAAITLMRDIVETGNLIDYFNTNRDEISKWRDSPPRERWNKYSPSEIRKFLDIRDGYREEKRKQVYQLMSKLGSHPDPDGFNIISRHGLGEIGPFLEDIKIKAVLSELAKWLPLYTLHFIEYFNDVELEITISTIHFLDYYNRWAKKYFKKDPITREIQDLKELLKNIE